MNGDGNPSFALLLDQTCGSGFAAVLSGYVRMFEYRGQSGSLRENMNLLHPQRKQPRLFSYPAGKKKVKAVPLQAWSGPEGSRKLRFPHFVTTAQDGGKVVSLTHRPPLPPGNTPDPAGSLIIILNKPCQLFP